MSLLVELPAGSYPERLEARLTHGGYSFQVARGLAWISQLVYETSDSKKLDEVLAHWQLDQLALLQSPSSALPFVDTRGLVLQGWCGTIVAFAGLDPLKIANWLTSVDSLLGVDDLHTGFENAVEAVWPQLRSAIFTQDREDKPLVLAGHSLGAALAVIAARFLEEAGRPVSGIYTLGMPRCGGSRFLAEYGPKFGPRTYRLVHGYDVVAALPPAGLGFRHIGRLLRCPHGGAFDPAAYPEQLESDQPAFIGELNDVLADLLKTLETFELPPATQPGSLGQVYRLLPAAIGDHIPCSYLSALGYPLK